LELEIWKGQNGVQGDSAIRKVNNVHA